MKVRYLTILFAICGTLSFAQKTDSLLNVQWQASLKKLGAGDYNDATLGFTQLYRVFPGEAQALSAVAR